MGKTKLTLYVDEEVSQKAKKISKLTGKSISSLVSDFLNNLDLSNHDFKVSEKVSRWQGIASSDKSYKKLRDEVFEEKLKNYEDTD